jgi:hypothetical protein
MKNDAVGAKAFATYFMGGTLVPGRWNVSNVVDFRLNMYLKSSTFDVFHLPVGRPYVVIS